MTKKYIEIPLGFLNGLRGVAMLQIIYAHMGVMFISMPRINYLEMIKVSTF